MIPRRGNSGVRLADHPDPGVSRRIQIGDDIASVACPVVDHQQFQVGVGLVEHRLNRLADVRRDVVRRHDYADGWHCADALTVTCETPVELDEFVQRLDRSLGRPAWSVEEIPGGRDPLLAPRIRVGERPSDRLDGVVDAFHRLRDRREQVDVVRMDVRQIDQRGPVNADDRLVAQQKLEPGGAVVGDHQVGRNQVGRDVVARCDHAPARTMSGSSRATQSTPPE